MKQDSLDILKKDTLTEQELNLIKRRINNSSKEERGQIFANFTGEYKLTEEQSQKAYKWLMNLWKTPKGVERKNNPYGLREQDDLENYTGIYLTDWYDTSRISSFSHYEPVYTIMTKEGYGFQYYVSGEINIIG